MPSSIHKRIIHNTAMLYMRMLLTLATGFYTSRVVLAALGVSDFGIYNVVAGFVALLGFMQSAMTSATQRYFAYDLSKTQGGNLCGLYNASLQIHALLALCISLVAETAGYWVVSTQLTIPVERLDAALLAYHLSVVSFAVQVMTVPLTAMLMANERMGLFSLMSMANALLKLAAVFMLPYLFHDKLAVYAALLLGVALLTFVGYLLINRANFLSVRLQWSWHPEHFRSMIGFTAWSAWGNLAAALAEHGNNVLLNIFFGPAVNAGRSIATQANGALNNFVLNVQAAINPQIVKQYASGQYHHMHDLVQKASKYNFFLLLVLSMPVLFYTEQLLEMWLINPPSYAAIFLRLTIITSLIDSLSLPMMTSAQATGKIRLYQAVIGGILLLNVPIAYLALKIWQKPTLVIWTGILLAAVAFIVRLFILKKLTDMPAGRYLRSVMSRVMIVSAAAGSINFLLTFPAANGAFLIASLVICFVTTLLAVHLIGLDASEKRYLATMITQTYRKLLNDKRFQ